MLTVAVVGTTLEVAAPASVVLGDTATIDVFLTDSNASGIQGLKLKSAQHWVTRSVILLRKPQVRPVKHRLLTQR